MEKKPKIKKFTTNNVEFLSEVLEIKVYINKQKRILFHIIKELKAEAHTKDIESLNASKSSNPIKAGQKIFLPKSIQTSAQLENITLSDIETFNLEQRIQKISNPAFFVLVSNTNEDNLGLLKLNHTHLHFKPLNPYLQGEFDFEEKKSLSRNEIMEFKISYLDISDEEPVIMPMPSMEEDKLDDFPIHFNCQLTLFKTGYYRSAEDKEKKIIDSFKNEKNFGIATVVLKIPDFDLIGRKRNNDGREGVANMIFSEMMRKKGRFEAEIERKNLKIEEGKDTTISVFDIIYENILPELEEQEGSKIENVDKKIQVLKSIFGYSEIKSVKNIYNQCMFPLEFTFPELGKQISFEEISQRRGGYLQDYTLIDHTKDCFNVPSKILSIEAGNRIKEDLPYYLRNQCMRQLYCLADDGASMRTVISRIMQRGPVLFVVLDKSLNVFGGFLSCDFKCSDEYYGSAESFLFKFDKNKDNEYESYQGTFNNEFYMFSNSDDGIGFGSDPHYGLMIDTDVLNGSTHHCKTYENPDLTENHHFKVKNLEIWCFEDDDDF